MTMLGRLWVVSRVLRTAFRAPALSLIVPAFYLPYWCLLRLGIGLDCLLSRPRGSGSKQTLLLAGAPRSGTTLLHRSLDSVGIGRATQAWEALLPSAVLQRLFGPVIRRCARSLSLAVDLSGAHQARWDLPEADDLGAFSQHLDSFFFYVYCLSWDSADHSGYLDAQARPRALVAREIASLKRAAQRNRISGSTSIALLKSFSAGFTLARASQALEGSRVVYLSRAPHETLPSSLSMVRSMLSRAGLYSRLGEAERVRHVDRIVDASLALQLAAIDSLQSLPAERLLIVRYEDLTRNLDTTLRRVANFVGLPTTQALEDRIRCHVAAERGYRSSHRYSLADFGLSEPQIRERFGVVYEYFNH